MTRGALKFLESLAKGAKGQISIDALQTALTMLGDWKVEEVAAFYPVTGSNDYDLRSWFDKNFPILKDTFQFTLDDKKNKGLTLFKNFPDRVLKGQFKKAPKSGPANPERGIVYSTNVGQIGAHPYGDDYSYLRWVPLGEKVWVGADGYRVTAPGGKTLDIPEKLSRSAHDWNSFKAATVWKFLYDNDVKKLAASYLADKGEGAVNAVVRPSSVRNLENTGTCSVCSRNAKLKARSKKIVDHGYQVPKWYQGRTRGCPGVGFPPIENSTEGAENYIAKHLEPAHKEAKKEQAALKKGPAKVTEKQGRKPATYKKGEPGYQRLVDYQTQNVESRIKQLDSELERFKMIVRNWKKAPLPGLKESGDSVGRGSLISQIDSFLESSSSDSDLVATRWELRDSVRVVANSVWGVDPAEYVASDGTPEGDRRAALDIAWSIGYDEEASGISRKGTLNKLAKLAKADGFLPALKRAFADGQKDAK